VCTCVSVCVCVCLCVFDRPRLSRVRCKRDVIAGVLVSFTLALNATNPVGRVSCIWQQQCLHWYTMAFTLCLLCVCVFMCVCNRPRLSRVRFKRDLIAGMLGSFALALNITNPVGRASCIWQQQCLHWYTMAFTLCLVCVFCV